MEKQQRTIYMDFAATTPMRADTIKTMERFWAEEYGNPSSIHSMGREAKSALDQARETCADVLKCKESEIYFTSGGTESDNLAVLGTARTNSKFENLNSKQILNSNVQNSKTNSNFQNKLKPHLITTQIEHHAVISPCKQLEKEGFEVTYLLVDNDGMINIDELKSSIRSETGLVSIMYVNNEIGTVQPIQQIGNLLKNYESRIMNYGPRKIIFHTDAIQAPGYFDLDVGELGVDLLSLSAHKFGGPKGVGLLYFKKGVAIDPLILGGDQELKLRAGTENVAGIVAMADALKAVTAKREWVNRNVTQLKDYFEKQIKLNFPKCLIIASDVERSPAISSIVFPSMEADLMVMNLDLKGVCVSSGAACSAGAVERSTVFEALQLGKSFDYGAVRFSFNESTTRAQIDYVVQSIRDILKNAENGRGSELS